MDAGNVYGPGVAEPALRTVGARPALQSALWGRAESAYLRLCACSPEGSSWKPGGAAPARRRERTDPRDSPGSRASWLCSLCSFLLYQFEQEIEFPRRKCPRKAGPGQEGSRGSFWLRMVSGSRAVSELRRRRLVPGRSVSWNVGQWGRV